MESGFDKDTAIKIINSILVLKSDDECFSTMDMTVIDLYEGDVEFVKVGAVPTYIVRDEGESAEIIRSASLPAGLLCNIEVELIHKTVRSGDFIVMMTDGLMDSYKCANGEHDLIKFLTEIKSRNPQEVADTILQKAFENCDGRPVDDMMVVVAKVWKRI
jgi:stage II sporulation protein E